MYKILNKLFGWDYIFWTTKDSSHQGIAKIIILPDWSSNFWCNKCLIGIHNKNFNIKFLTCKPDKYIK